MRFSNRFWRLGWPVSACITILFIFLGAPADSGSKIPDSDCLDCHDGQDKTLMQGPHRLASTIDKPVTEVACVNCHFGSEIHVEDPSADNIENPSKMSGYEADRVCRQCHVRCGFLDNYGFNAHSEMEMNCSTCHKIHGQSRSVLQDDNANFCTACHQNKSTAFIGISNHTLMAGTVTCLSCHRFTSRVKDDLAYNLAGTCAQCHPQKTGPFLYEHEANTAYSVEGGGCMECHTPHNSQNDFLLKQPDRMLCRQCHMAPPKHRNNVIHGNAWAGYDCVVCHTEIHGSFDNRLFLDPDLASRWGINCYQAGCHDVSH